MLDETNMLIDLVACGLLSVQTLVLMHIRVMCNLHDQYVLLQVLAESLHGMDGVLLFC
jgi:hypothetical protein